MARYDPDRRGFGELLRSRVVQKACLDVAGPEAARIAAATPRDTGKTAATTRVEPADFGDRKGAYIVQEGASVAVNFGNARTPAQHYVHRGR
jgi:hypothetical protein